MGVMHAAKIEKSETLQRLRDYLTTQGATGATSYQLVVALELVAPATWVSALRKNGYDVECKYEGTNPHGSRIYRYVLRGVSA